MTTEQIREAEKAYIFHDTTLPEISQEMEIPQEELAEYKDVWEHRRQAYRTAEYFFCREGKTLKEITKLSPLSLEELTAHLPVLEERRAAYLASVPSPFLQIHALLEERVDELTRHPTPLIPLEKIQKLYDTLKPTASVFDHYELILNILTQHFLPTKHFDQILEDRLIAVLEEFRGFLKMQLLSGNR